MIRQWRGHLVVAVSILAGAQFVIVVDETTMGLVAPAVARDLDLGSSARQVLVTPFAAAFLCGLPVAGLLLRSVAPSRILAPAAVLFAASASLGGSVRTLVELTITRAAQGFSAAVLSTAVLATLHALTRTDTRRIHAFAAFSLLSGAGALTALLVVGPITDISWRWCFWGIGGAAAFCALWWATFAHTGLAIADDVGNPVPPASIDSTTVATLTSAVATNAVLAATVITASFTLQIDRGWSAAMTGMGFLPLNVAAAIGMLTVARSSERASIGAPPIAGAMALAVGGVAMTWWTAMGGPTPALLLATIPVGLGVGVVFPLMNSRSMDTAGTLSMGRAAQLGASAQVGLALGAIAAAAHSAAALAGLTAVSAIAVVVDTEIRRRTLSADARPPVSPPVE